MPQHQLCEKDARFEHYLIHKGGNWRLYLNAHDQRYLGRSYAWLTNRHVDRMLLHDLTPVERNELFNISRRFWKSLVALGWNPGLLNECWLGNEIETHHGHGHMHFIPRYEHPPEFGGRGFPDHRWGSNYTPHSRLELPEYELQTIRHNLSLAFRKAR